MLEMGILLRGCHWSQNCCLSYNSRLIVGVLLDLCMILRCMIVELVRDDQVLFFWMSKRWDCERSKH